MIDALILHSSTPIDFFFLATLYHTKFGGVYPKRAFIVQLCVAIEAGGVHAN
jgi:hypothetical protein